MCCLNCHPKQREIRCLEVFKAQNYQLIHASVEYKYKNEDKLTMAVWEYVNVCDENVLFCGCYWPALSLRTSACDHCTSSWLSRWCHINHLGTCASDATFIGHILDRLLTNKNLEFHFHVCISLKELYIIWRFLCTVGWELM